MVDISKRIVLLHGHMFKNAGTSLDKILQNNFGDSFLDHREDEMMAKGGQAYIEEYLQAHPNVKALSSHHLPVPLISTNLLEFKIMVLLRDPIVRVASVYRFERQQISSTPGAIAAKKYDMPDYLRWRLEERPGTICNYFSRYLTSALPGDGHSGKLFDKASGVLEQIYFVGIVENFGGSMRILGKQIKKYFPGFAIQDVRENITDSREISNIQRKEELATAIGSELFDRLVCANEADIALYELACSHLQKELVINFELS